MTLTRRNVATRRTIVALSLGGTGAGLAHGQIEFSASGDYIVPTSVWDLVGVDMNGDALRDLVVAEGLESVTLFENIGAGAFERVGSHFEPATWPSHIRAGDVNADGHADLVWVVQRGQSWSLRVFYNSGDGRAGVVKAIDLERTVGAMSLGDVTGDGRPDLAIADSGHEQPMLRVFENVDGAFVPTESIELPFLDNRDLVIGDVDGDGDLDVAVLSLDDWYSSEYGWKLYESQIRLFSNDGTGHFPDRRVIPLPFGGGWYSEDRLPEALQIADLDGDADRDLAVAAAMQRYPDATASVLPIENIDQGQAFSVRDEILFYDQIEMADLQVGDLDTDGDIDVVFRAGSNVWAVENLGGFVFVPAEVITEVAAGPSIALADLDGDGDLDVANGSRGRLSVFENVTPYSGPVLFHGPLVRGHAAAMVVRGVEADEAVHFLYSVRGAGNSAGILTFGGLTLDLNEPIRLAGAARADTQGVARIRVSVPPDAPLVEVVLQAAMHRGAGGVDSVKTPFRMARITN